jgi:hypothetical protein
MQIQGMELKLNCAEQKPNKAESSKSSGGGKGEAWPSGSYGSDTEAADLGFN